VERGVGFAGVFKSRWGHKGVEGGFLAGESRIFEVLVNSIGERLVFDGLVRCFFPWAFFVSDKARPRVELWQFN
jgi:hypothetical protein